MLGLSFYLTSYKSYHFYHAFCYLWLEIKSYVCIILVIFIFIISLIFSKFKEEYFLKHTPKNSAPSIFTQNAKNIGKIVFKPSSCCANTQNKTNDTKINFKKLFKESIANYKKLLPYIVIAVLIGALIHDFIPQEILQKYLNGNEILSIVLAAFLGIFLYLRAETIIPIGLILLEMGISQGVIMSFLIAGAGCSLPELVLLKQMFKMKFLLLFIAIILSIAISFGMLINFI